MLIPKSMDRGKDRTGLVVLLLLLLLKVPKAAIIADYRASERELKAEMEERISDLRKAGLEKDFARCPEGFVEVSTASFLHFWLRLYITSRRRARNIGGNSCGFRQVSKNGKADSKNVLRRLS